MNYYVEVPPIIALVNIIKQMGVSGEIIMNFVVLVIIIAIALWLVGGK